jgi:catechol 2,3-dioxygenase-like lactoylglutathione lyase family enzyme
MMDIRADGVLEAALYVDDLDAAEAFYGGVLKFDHITRVDNRHSFYRCGTTILLLFNAVETIRPTQNTNLPVPPHGASGAGHVCFAMDGGRLQDLVHHLGANSIEIEADFCWPNGARSIYFRDPSGNSIEYAEPRLWFDEA